MTDDELIAALRVPRSVPMHARVSRKLLAEAADRIEQMRQRLEYVDRVSAMERDAKSQLDFDAAIRRQQQRLRDERNRRALERQRSPWWEFWT